MTVTATPIYPQAIGTGHVQILPADTTTNKTLYTAGANGSRIKNISISNTDNIAYLVQLSVTISATTYLISTTKVATNAGFNTGGAAVATTPVLTTVLIPGITRDSNGNTYLDLVAGAVLVVNSTTTVSTAKALTITCTAEDF